MKWLSNWIAHWRSALAGAGLCVAIGALLLWMNGWPVLLSYDLLFLFRNPAPPDDAVIVYMDDRSYADLGQRSSEFWDRSLHARLLDRLTDDECKLAVFDIIFSEPANPEADDRLAQAMKRNGKVVLAATLDVQARPQVRVRGPAPLLPEFAQAAAGSGLASVAIGPGQIVRQYYDGKVYGPSLPQVAARLADGRRTSAADENEVGNWLNYYGPPLTLNNISYSEALEQPQGYFRGKMVFIGARAKTLKAQDEVDEFRTPYTLWTQDRPLTPGVEICATAFLNRIRGDGFTRSNVHAEWWLVLLTGLALGSATSLWRPILASAVALIGLGVLLIAAFEAARHHIWFPWTVVAFVQIPVALGWSLRCHFHRLKFEKAVLERTLVETSRFAEATAARAKEAGLAIPDHTLVRCVGKGAYGEVWLARNAIGVFHAVKIVRRDSFPADAPYEREFKGIQKFMPISRSHAGFVNVLHVGRNDEAGYFFCIMEAADDQTSAQQINSEAYSPKTLAGELRWRGKLPPEECLQLGLALSLSLEHLHRQQLIHRDIKPGNIIYVNGAPKLADIGLVAELRSESGDVSLVGTEGYIPPEGPGTPSADVYALGKVLYEACMGRDRQLFPEVPTVVWEQPDDALVRQLNEVIGQACATDSGERFQSAAELHAALARLENKQGGR